MSLKIALDVANTSLAARQAEMAVTGRNISGAGEDGYTRKNALVTALSDGSVYGVRFNGVSRTANEALLGTLLENISDHKLRQTVIEGMNQLSRTVLDPEDEQSVAARLGKLADALQTLGTKPADQSAARDVLAKAQDVVRTLSEASAIVQETRLAMDAAMQQSVNTVNGLLRDLQDLNTSIVQRTSMGADVTDQLDARENILRSLSEQIGIRVIRRDRNDIALTTDSGVMLFDRQARQLTFTPTATLAGGATGNPVTVDGMPITGPRSPMPIRTGALFGATQMRDTTAVNVQRQLDEIARGLIQAFSETDQNPAAPTKPARPGLFTWPGAPALPAAGTLINGLASQITVASSVDPTQGGQLSRLRDGGISTPADPDYTYNSTGAAGFSARVEQLLSAMRTAQTFDGAAQLPTNTDLMSFSSSAVGWVEATRKSADSAATRQQTVLQRSSEAYKNSTGVNLDEELILLMDIQRSFGASTKIVSAVDEMLKDLLGSVR